MEQPAIADSTVCLGIDMSTTPGHTALAAIATSPTRGSELVAAHPKVRHDQLLEVLSTWDYAVASVDVPFGWPDAFTSVVASHMQGPLASVPAPGTGEAHSWRVRSVALRATDAFVYDLYGVRPMAIGFDKLGATAAAWALIESALGKQGISRSGKPRSKRRIVETYPAAQLKAWGVPAAKLSPEQLEELAKQHEVRIGGHHHDLATSADLRDAFVCALTATLIAPQDAHCHAMTDKPNGKQANREGVIWLHDPKFKPDCRSVWTFNEGFPVDSGCGPPQRCRRAPRRSPRTSGR